MDKKNKKIKGPILVLVSVVIPAHNEEAWIASCIKSFINQSYKNIEIIIVEDASTDNTLMIASNYPVRIIRHKECLGEALTRIEGTKAARGEIIIHGEADAVYPSDYIEKGLRYFEDPKTMAVSCGQIKVHPSLKGLIADYCRAKRFGSFQMRLKGKKFTHGCHMIRREVFEKIGYYDQSLVVGSDADFAFRINSAKMKIVWASDMYFYHVDPTNLQSFLKRTFKGNLYRRKFLERWNMWPKRWQMSIFLLWNIFVTMIPIYFFLSWFNNLFLINILIPLLAEGIGPFLIREEFRMEVCYAVRKKNLLLLICLPAITFLRIRAASYGALAAVVFSEKVGKQVTFK